MFHCPTCGGQFMYMDDAVYHFINEHLIRLLTRPEEFRKTHAPEVEKGVELIIAGYITRWGGVLSENPNSGDDLG